MYTENLNRVLLEIAAGKLGRSEEHWKSLRTLRQLHALQAKVRRNLWTQLGGRPAKPCALRPRVTGAIRAPGYRIEKLYFQSIERFYVTANLYVPERLAAPAPAVLCPVGHAPPAKAFPEYQVLFANLARRGFVVLAFDPLGQGERGPNYSVFHGDTGGNAHDAQGFQCFLTSRPLSFYFLWDCVRALDYLCGRPEVDAGRLGCTGTSGGGTQTLLLAALDERIKAAVPVCSVGWPLDIFTVWMMHPEANFVDAFTPLGPNHVNLSLCVLPRKLLLIGGSEDHLPATGMRRLSSLVRGVCARTGAENAVRFAATINHHGYPLEMRMRAYEFLAEHLAPKGPRPGAEISTEILPARRLWATKRGDVRQLRSTNVHRMNHALAREQSRRAGHMSISSLRREWGKLLLPGGAPAVRLRVIPAPPLRLRTDDPAFLCVHQVLAGTDGVPLQRVNLYRPAKTTRGVLVMVRDFGYPQCGALLEQAVHRGVRVITGELYPVDHQRLLLAGLTPAGWHWLVWRKVIRTLVSPHRFRADELRLVVEGSAATLVGLALASELPQSKGGLTVLSAHTSWIKWVADERLCVPDLQCTPGLLNRLDLPLALRTLNAKQVPGSGRGVYGRLAKTLWD